MFYFNSLNVINSYHMIAIYPAYINKRNIDSNNVIRPSDKHYLHLHIIYHNILFVYFSHLL